MPDYEKTNFFQRLRKGLADSVAYSQGKLSLKTTQLPAPPPPASAQQVVSLRTKLNMSQSVFAATLNVSTRLVQSWEQGLRKPSRSDLRLIEILNHQPAIVQRLFQHGHGGSVKASGSRKSRAKVA